MRFILTLASVALLFGAISFAAPAKKKSTPKSSSITKAKTKSKTQKSKSSAKPKSRAPAKKTEASNNPWDCQLARIARLSVNSSHRSCEPSRKPKGLKNLRVKDHACKPVNEKPIKGLKCSNRSVASYGSGKRMEVINRIINPTPDGKTDCSGFVSGVFCRAGARIRPGVSCALTHTAELMTLGTDKDCFETMKFTKQEHLRPGCMIVWRKGTGGHVVMVQKVGKDPFGLKAGCHEDPNFNRWNFEIAESARSGGPTIYDARRRFSKNGDEDRLALVLLRKRLCEAVEKNEPLFAATWDDDMSAKILCHAGPKRPQCVEKKNQRFFKAEACIAHCTP